VQGIGGRPFRTAQERAAEVRQMSNRQLNRRTATSTMRDRVTGREYTDTSGNTPESPRLTTEQIHPELRARMPNQSLEDWPIENCAEFKATNRALWDGAEFENLDGATINSRSGNAMHRCANCQYSTSGARVSTDNAPWLYPGVVVGGSTAEETQP
jgi:hypothetical protein